MKPEHAYLRRRLMVCTEALPLIFKAACAHAGITEADARSRRRFASSVWARQLFFWLAHQHDYSHREAEAFLSGSHALGNRGFKVVEGARSAYPAVKAETDQLKAEVSAQLQIQ
jgi:hypothetical protein